MEERRQSLARAARNKMETKRGHSHRRQDAAVLGARGQRLMIQHAAAIIANPTQRVQEICDWAKKACPAIASPVTAKREIQETEDLRERVDGIKHLGKRQCKIDNEKLKVLDISDFWKFHSF
jgi:hypothetical protein